MANAVLGFDDYCDRFHLIRNRRCVFTRDEIRAAWEDGMAHDRLAHRNDELVAEYGISD